MKAHPRSTWPVVVSSVFWVVLALGIWNLGRAIVLWQQASWLNDLEIEPNPVWRLTMSVGWFLLYSALAVAILRQASWALWTTPAVLTAYAVVELGLRLVYATTPPSLALLLLYAAPLLFVLLAFSRPAAKRYFQHSELQEVADKRIP